MTTEIYYDGECPFCTAYMRMLNLRHNVGPVELIDGRSSDPRIAQLGADLNEGMALRYGGRLYVGADAVHMLSILSANSGLWTRVMRSPRRAALLYPLLRGVRNATLRILDRRPI